MQANMTIEQVNRALQRKRTMQKVGKILANVFIYFALALMYAPLVYITIYSFTKSEATGAWSGFTMCSICSSIVMFPLPVIDLPQTQIRL